MLRVCVVEDCPGLGSGGKIMGKNGREKEGYSSAQR